MKKSIISFLLIASAYIINMMCIISSCSLQAGFETGQYASHEPLDDYSQELASSIMSCLLSQNEDRTQKINKIIELQDAFYTALKMQLFKNYGFLKLISQKMECNFVLHYVSGGAKKVYWENLAVIVYESPCLQKNNLSEYTDALVNMITTPQNIDLLAQQDIPNIQKVITALIPYINRGLSLYGNAFKVAYMQKIRPAYEEKKSLNTFVSFLDTFSNIGA
ncbi:MAG: hypothetical protein HAW62_02850 [Endozoicomonadaceae bacterium]|nr:hypothetical protein [Endozoicomonadaceae bacterium]